METNEHKPQDTVGKEKKQQTQNTAQPLQETSAGNTTTLSDITETNIPAEALEVDESKSPLKATAETEPSPVEESVEPSTENPANNLTVSDNTDKAENELPNKIDDLAVIGPVDGIIDPIAPAITQAAKDQPTIPQKKQEEANNNAETDDSIKEIEEENAEDAEDHHNQKRHTIPMPDYHAMSMENLVGELQRLVKNEKVQAINKHASAIRNEFKQKFQQVFDEKKEEFIENGGNEIDFRYNSIAKRQFNEVYAEYKEKLDLYYKNLEKTLKQNLQHRLEIIVELKGLVSLEEDMNTTYNNFKALQSKWRSAGPVPRTSYNDVWRTYHHHVEIFYDFLHLNRELRDLDFKHNLEEKTKLVERAEALAQEPDLGKAFRILQNLHKIWKEEIGPVAKEQREEIWQRFSNATKILHQRRKEHLAQLDAIYEKNLEKKREIITSITEISDAVAKNHRGIQDQIKKIEILREAFFKGGKVPQKDNEATWVAFKQAVRSFNRNKNAFYKNLKQGQHENLEKKKALLGLALSLKESDDFEMATPEMKRIQAEWKTIGHVPRKYSDKIWKEFRDACNHYFDRIHAERNASQREEYANLDQKTKLLDQLRAFALTGDTKKDVDTLGKLMAKWKAIGHIPHNKRHINGKFNKIIDAIFKKLNVGKHQVELLKYGDRIKQLTNTEDGKAIGNERYFIRKKIEESKSEIRQLENNLQFFSNASEDNPLVKDVIQNIDKQKEALETWKEKLKKLNILENNLGKSQSGSDLGEEE